MTNEPSISSSLVRMAWCWCSGEWISTPDPSKKSSQYLEERYPIRWRKLFRGAPSSRTKIKFMNDDCDELEPKSMLMKLCGDILIIIRRNHPSKTEQAAHQLWSFD